MLLKVIIRKKAKQMKIKKVQGICLKMSGKSRMFLKYGRMMVVR